MHVSTLAAPGAGTPGGLNHQGIAEFLKNNALRLIDQEPLPIGGLVGPIASGDGLADFLADAGVGEIMQTILRPTPIHRLGRVNNEDLLAISRIHSEACLSIVRGFDRFILVAAIPAESAR